MSSIFLLLVILLPLLGGVSVSLIPWKKQKSYEIFSFLIVLLTSVIVYVLILNPPEQAFVLFQFTGNLKVSFQVDGLSRIFSGLIAVLWPLAMLYAFEYMEHEKHQKIFYTFYIMTYGVTLGISFSDNMMSLYFFYELLTLVTVPLVMHTLTTEAIIASRKYLYYSLGGAAFAFIGLVLAYVYGNSLTFQMGGVMGGVESHHTIILLGYVLAFCGFGVKAAIFPFNGWLPTASVAPTPVTALLHAVAVVKSGAFSIMRLTFYIYGAGYLKGSWAQHVVMAIAMVTILYGSSMAVKERHLKRRLAYSTISNLSYILFGVTLMTPYGLAAALLHMVFHAFMKITGFFCAGAVLHKTKRNYVFELNGLGFKMPVTFGCFLIASLGLVGVPLFPGFLSKWYLAFGAVKTGDPWAFVGIGVLTISAFLTAIYMLNIVVRAFFLPYEMPAEGIETDPGWKMKLPLILFCVAILIMGMHGKPLITLIFKTAGAL
ncbi:MAG: proton-conducting transporter membrane subunit [Lachnospiraceae bacterium]|nr:proton-conducting transporter membrane subunit [Lachnospiraceae bacterium]